MKNMKMYWTKINKYWITIWLAIIVITVTSIVSYAAYTRVTVAKRVISTGEGAGFPFGSDLMSSTVKKIKRMPFSDQNDTPDIPLNIFNYPYPRRSSCGRDDTIYDLTVTLGTLDDLNNFSPLTGTDITDLGTGYVVVEEQGQQRSYTFGSDNKITHTFSNCSITGGNFNSNLFTMKFDPAELTAEIPKGYCMKMEAIPGDSELPSLTGYVLVRYIRTADSGWSGELEELTADTDYDAYNYVIKGSGKGNFTFKWNASKVAINQQFLQNSDVKFLVNGTPISGNPSFKENDISPDGDGFRSLTIIVDSSKTSRYDVQFYKVNNTIGGASGYATSDIAGYIPRSTAWTSS